MIWKIFCVVILQVVLAVRSSAPKSDKQNHPYKFNKDDYNPLFKDSSDFALAQRGCFQTQIGFDYL